MAREPYECVQSPFFHAIQNGDDQQLRRLANSDSIEERDAMGFTPLAYSAVVNNVNAITLLLSLGANVDSRIPFTSTPFMHACIYDSADAASELIRHGADVNSNGFATPLFMAALCGHPRMVKIVLDAGAIIDLPVVEGSDKGRTALFGAVLQNQHVTASVLLAAGANPRLKDASGDDCISWCETHGDAELLAILKS